MIENQPPSFWDSLIAVLEELEATGQALKKALLARDTEAIWSAVEQQEAAALRLERLQQERRRQAPRAPAKAPSSIAQQIRALALRTQMAQRVNRAMTHGFLKIIDGTFAAAAQRSTPPALTYSARGRFERAAVPLFVHQIG